MGKSGVTAVCHGAFAMEACCTPCHSGGRRSFSSRFLLAATYWVRSGRLQVAGVAWLAMLLVCTRHCQSLAKVPQFRAGVHADCTSWAVRGPRWSVSDFWWNLGPTAWNVVGSTLHLQQPDWQATSLRMVHQASDSACCRTFFVGNACCSTFFVGNAYAFPLLGRFTSTDSYGRNTPRTNEE